MPLTSVQARRMFDPDERANAGIAATDAELIDNPYLLYETDRGRLDAISLAMVDRSMFPRDTAIAAALAADPIPDPVTEAGDDRRVRAASVLVLEQAAADGHVLQRGAGRLPRATSGARVRPGGFWVARTHRCLDSRSAPGIGLA